MTAAQPRDRWPAARAPVAAALLAALATAPAAAQDPVDALLEGLGADVARLPKVEVSGRVDRDPVDPALVLRVTPAAGTRLVADPGITVHVGDGAAAALAVPGQDYLSAPAELRVPLAAAAPDRAWPVRVEYAYCVVDRQCLFGEATLVVPPTGTTRVCAAGTQPIAC